MIAFFLSNISAQYYKNPYMLSGVIAKNVGDVFLRHSVVSGEVKFIRIYAGITPAKQWRRHAGARAPAGKGCAPADEVVQN